MGKKGAKKKNGRKRQAKSNDRFHAKPTCHAPYATPFSTPLRLLQLNQI